MQITWAVCSKYNKQWNVVIFQKILVCSEKQGNFRSNSFYFKWRTEYSGIRKINYYIVAVGRSRSEEMSGFYQGKTSKENKSSSHVWGEKTVKQKKKMNWVEITARENHEVYGGSFLLKHCSILIICKVIIILMYFWILPQLLIAIIR